MRQMTLKKAVACGGERGVVLITALLVMVFLLPLGVMFLQVALTENTIASNEVASARAFNLGEAGLQHASKALQAVDLSEVLDGTTNVFPGGNIANLAGGSYTVQVINNIAANGFPRGTVGVDPSGSATVDSDSIIVVTSTGNFQGSQQAVETVLQIGSFPQFTSTLGQVSNGANELRLDGSAIVTGIEQSGTCPDGAGLVWSGSSIDTDVGNLQGSPPLRAHSTPPDDPALGDPASMLDLLNTWKSLPGVVTISGNPPATLGTAANPQITVW